MVRLFSTDRRGGHGGQRDLDALLAIGDRYERDAVPPDTAASLRRLHRWADREAPVTAAGPVQRAAQIYVPLGTIGLVVAREGRMPPAGSRLAPFIECDFFQDGAAFLRDGGYQGRQLQVLSGGRYDIDPDIFDVITVDNLADHPRLDLVMDDLREIEIPVGETGVVITHLGVAADDLSGTGTPVSGHSFFSCPWVFLANGGQLGVQSQTLPAGGLYAINPWFAHVVKVPTRSLILEWTKAPKASSSFDASLDQIVLDVQGYTIRLDMTQTLRIPERAAPLLVRQFGDPARRGRGQASERTPVREFVEKELAAIVAGYFRMISARYEILEFITRYDDLSADLSREVRAALARSGIEAMATTLGTYECEPGDMNELRRSIAIEMHKVKSLEAVLASSRISAEIEQMTIDLDAARRRLELVQVQGLVELLGPAQVASERVLAEWVKMGVPHTIASGGNDDMAKALMDAMPFTQARDMLLALASEAGRHQSKGRQQAIHSGEDE
jgi:hypothetical protein